MLVKKKRVRRKMKKHGARCISSLPVEGTPYVGGVDPVWDSVPSTTGSLK